MRRLLALGMVAACGSGPDPAFVERPLALERWSPPQHTSYDVFLAARGDVIAMQRRISRDRGATWSALEPSLGSLTRVAIHGTTLITHSSNRGLVRWDLATGTIAELTGEPGFATERTWRTTPAGQLLAFDEVDNAIAIERAGGWLQGTLPQPTATEVLPYIQDVESNGQLVLATSAWGIHRSADGASWQLVTANTPGGGRDLLVLADGRFVLVGGTTSYLFDPAGQPAGTLPDFGVVDGEAMVCEDGSIVARGKLTRDLGATWQRLIPESDLDMIVERGGCGAGSYWALAISATWGYRLLRFDAAGSAGVAVGNWEATEASWQPGGPPIALDDDGTFLVAGLAWREAEPGWTLRETPSKIWASGGALFGVADSAFFISRDGGVTWTAAVGAGLDEQDPEAFALAPDGSLHVSRFTGEKLGTTDQWRSVVWRSTDEGASWSPVYDRTATRTEGEDIAGEVHRFVGILDDGAWIATDAVSQDQGVTWTPTEATGDRSLAFLTRNGSLVTTLPAGTPKEDIWRVYADGGLGPQTGTFRIEVDGMPVPASQLRSIAFDDEGHIYVARGAPYVQIWRSAKPIEPLPSGR
jgi:hypothetical protein